MKSFYLLLISLSIFSCSNSNFEYKELKDCNFDIVKLEEQTKIKVLSYSGGKYCDNETNYYYQFIGVNQKNLDTVRILSLCQKYEFVEGKKIGSFTSKVNMSDIINQIGEQYGLDNNSNEKMVVFNKERSAFELGNYMTAIGSLSF
jgi:hypothetical protein